MGSNGSPPFPPPPVACYTPYPSPHSTAPPVVRDFVLQNNNNNNNNNKTILTAAVGDAWGLYQWDVESGERIMTTTPVPYRHGPVASLSQFEKTGLLLIASENGIVSIQRSPTDWTEIDLKSLLTAPSLPTSPQAQSQSQSQQPHHHRQFRTRPEPLPDLILTGVEAVNDCWWTVAGRYVTNGGGFVATVHAATNTVVAKVNTPDIPQRLVLLDSPDGPALVASASNAPLVRVWHPLTLDRPHAVWCTASIVSGHALTSYGDFVVVGGVGGLLEVFHRSIRILALSCY